jgi:hypothetical protein
MGRYEKHELKAGRRFVKDKMPAIMASVKIGEDTALAATSSLGQSLLPHMTRDRIDALVVFQRNGGWMAEAVLKDLPAGLPNVMGTPENMPLGTRKEAEEQGCQLLKAFAALIKENELLQSGPDQIIPGKAERVMVLDNFDMFVPGEAVEMVAANLPMVEAAFPNLKGETFERLEANLQELTQGLPFDPAQYEAASEDLRGRIFANICTLLAMGENHYPRRFMDEPEVTKREPYGPDF